MRHPAIHDTLLEDLEQELMLDFLSRKQAYDPKRAKWSTFIDRILRYKCASLIASAKAKKRGFGLNTFSLEAWLEQNGCKNQTLSDPTTENIDMHDLRIDLERAMEDMPKHLVLLIIDLCTLSITEISSKNHTPRTTLYGKLYELRNFLRERGLKSIWINQTSTILFYSQ